MNKKPATKRQDILNYLHSQVLTERGPDCLIWPFGKSGAGYGQIRIDGKLTYVHRIACEFKNGKQPSDKPLALHICGKGHLGCCNPMHMKWGTHTENMRQRVADGDDRKGEKHPLSKLTEAQAKEILALKGKHSQRAIARMFGITHGAVGMIHNGKRWPHLQQGK